MNRTLHVEDITGCVDCPMSMVVGADHLCCIHPDCGAGTNEPGPRRIPDEVCNDDSSDCPQFPEWCPLPETPEVEEPDFDLCV